ncbi:MAG: hypothetical protein ACLSGS_02460 [Adlercreutzia sp.]
MAAKMPNAMSMMVAKPESTVICMSNAALVALPGAMPRRRASSTTSVVPAVERGRDSVHEERTEHERQRLARIHVLVDGLEGV